MSLNTFDDIKQRLQNESSILRNMSNVINKLTSDNNILPTFFTNVLEIFKNEMVFTYSVLNKISDSEDNFDMKEQFMNNIYIFKENFKILTTIIVEDVWKNFVTETEYEKVKSNNLSFVSLIENNFTDHRNQNQQFNNNLAFGELTKSPGVQPPQTIEEVDDEEDTQSHVSSIKSDKANLIVSVQNNDPQDIMIEKNRQAIDNIEINLSYDKNEVEQQKQIKDKISLDNSLYQDDSIKSMHLSKYETDSNCSPNKDTERSSCTENSQNQLDNQYSMSTEMLKKVQEKQRDSVNSQGNSIKNQNSINNETAIIKRENSLSNLYTFDDVQAAKKESRKKTNFFDSKTSNSDKNSTVNKKKQDTSSTETKPKTVSNSQAHSKKKPKNQRKSTIEVAATTNDNQKVDTQEKKSDQNQLEQDFALAKQDTEQNYKNLSHNYLNLNFPSAGNGSSQNISITINNASHNSSQNIAPVIKNAEQSSKRSKSTKIKKTGSFRDCYKDNINQEVNNINSQNNNEVSNERNLRGRELELTKENCLSSKADHKREGNNKNIGYSNFNDRRYRKNVGLNSYLSNSSNTNSIQPPANTPISNQNIIIAPETPPTTNNVQISTNNSSALNSQIHTNNTCNAYSNIVQTQNNSQTNLKNEGPISIKTPENSRSFCMRQGKSKDKILNNNNRKHYLYSDESEKIFIGNNRETYVSSSYMRILKTLERSKNDTREQEPIKTEISTPTIKKKDRHENRIKDSKGQRNNYAKPTNKN